MTSTPLLFFPVNAHPAQADAYAYRYLRAVQSARASAEQLDEATMQTLVRSAVGSRPALLDAESGLQAIPQAQQDVLAQKQRIFLLFWRRVYPLLDGETLLTEQVTFTAESWNGHPPYIAYYERRTDQGELALVLPSVHIDPQTGQLDYSSVASGALPALISPSNQALRGSSDAIDIIQSILGMVTWVGMGMGPEGMVVAAVAGILEVIFGLLRPAASPVSLPKIVDDILKRDLAEDHILKNVTTILTYIDWLNNQNQDALQGQMSSFDPVKYKDVLADLKRFVTDACNPSMPLLQAIGDLQRGNYPCDPSYQILSLPAFLLGASTHLLFEKCRILFLTDATTFRSPITHELVNVAKGYLAHTQKVVGQIEEVFQTRLGSIHDPQRHIYHSGPNLHNAAEHAYLYIEDSHADKYPEQKIVSDRLSSGDQWPNDEKRDANVIWQKECWAKSCTSTDATECDWDAARSWKAEYVNRVTSTLETKYNYPAERRADTHKVIAELEEAIRQFEPLIK